VRHVEEPGYSAYAVLQVCSSLVMDDLRRLVDHVRDLVGETDFSFKISDQSSSSVILGRPWIMGVLEMERGSGTEIVWVIERKAGESIPGLHTKAVI